MRDKNGELIKAGDKVKCFGNIRGIVIDFTCTRGKEYAVVTLYEKLGTSDAKVESENIKKYYWDETKYERKEKEKYWDRVRKRSKYVEK